MGNAIRQLFSFFTTLFAALERSAQIIDNIATVGQEMSAAYVDESRHNRAKAAMLLNKELSDTESQVSSK